MKFNKNEKGFTLVEITIVLVIIGLLVGGVLKGQELITNAKIKSLTKDMLNIQIAYSAYKDRTGQYPAPRTEGFPHAFPDTDRSFWRNLRKEGFIIDSDYISPIRTIGPKYALGGQFIFLGTVTPYFKNDHNQYLCAHSVSVKYARGIDLKLDDGLPLTGHIKPLQVNQAVKNYDNFPSQETEILLCMRM